MGQAASEWHKGSTIESPVAPYSTILVAALVAWAARLWVAVELRPDLSGGAQTDLAADNGNVPHRS